MRQGPKASRRAALAGLLALAADRALAGAPLRAQLPVSRPGGPGAPIDGAALVAEATRKGLTGATGFALVDVATGETLDASAAGRAFPPASVVKALTALHALETLGPDHRFETRLVVAGPIEDGVAAGDVALVGGGDPELDTADLAELAAQAHGRGLTGAAGRFLVDPGGPETDRIDPEQIEAAAYNPGVGGLNLNFNRVLFSWRRSGRDVELGLAAPAIGATAAPTTLAIGLAEGAGPVFARTEAAGRELWSVQGAALSREGKRWLPVRRPAIYAGDVFRSLAAEQGLTLPAPELGAAPAGATVVARRFSRPLAAILEDMLEHSTNLTAEVVGRAATGRSGLEASGAALADWAAARAGARPVGGATMGGIAARMLAAEAASAPDGALVLRNHSGLSAESRISPAAMTAFLRAAAREGRGAAPADALAPLLDEVRLDARRGEAPLPDGVACAAKTGTLNFVRGLSGYLTAASGRRLAFAIFSEDLARRAALPDPSAPGISRGWLSRARRLERDLLRSWAAGH